MNFDASLHVVAAPQAAAETRVRTELRAGCRVQEVFARHRVM